MTILTISEVMSIEFPECIAGCRLTAGQSIARAFPKKPSYQWTGHRSQGSSGLSGHSVNRANSSEKHTTRYRFTTEGIAFFQMLELQEVEVINTFAFIFDLINNEHARSAEDRHIDTNDGTLCKASVPSIGR